MCCNGYLVLHSACRFNRNYGFSGDNSRFQARSTLAHPSGPSHLIDFGGAGDWFGRNYPTSKGKVWSPWNLVKSSAADRNWLSHQETHSAGKTTPLWPQIETRKGKSLLLADIKVSRDNYSFRLERDSVTEITAFFTGT